MLFRVRLWTAIWLSCLCFGTLQLAGQTSPRIIDQLPAENALYCWTTDSEAFFEVAIESSGLSIEQFENALLLPKEWSEKRSDLQWHKAEHTLELFQTMVDAWKTPLFSGEAVLIYKYKSPTHRTTVLIAEAPAELSDYEAFMDACYQLWTSRELVKRSLGTWAHLDGRFFWAERQETLDETLAYFTDEAQAAMTDRDRLTGNRAFEMVFRSIEQQARDKAVCSFYLPPAARQLALTLGDDRGTNNFSNVTTPVWLDLMMDVRAAGACVWPNEVKEDGEDTEQLIIDGFVLLSQPRGPISSALQTLDDDQWQPPVLPNPTGMILAFGIDGQRLASEHEAMVAREERLPEYFGKGQTVVTTISDAEGNQQEMSIDLPMPSAIALNSLSQALQSTNTVTFVAGKGFAPASSLFRSVGTFRPFLFAQSDSSSSAYDTLKAYISEDVKATLTLAFTAYPFEWQETSSFAADKTIWETTSHFKQTHVERYNQIYEDQLDTYSERFGLDSETELEAMLERAGVPTLRAATTSAFESVWLQQAEWLALTPIEYSLIENADEQSSVDRRNQVFARVAEDLNRLKQLSKSPQPMTGFAAIATDFLGVQAGVIDDSHQNPKMAEFFNLHRPLNEKVDKDWVQLSSSFQRRVQVEYTLLKSFDRLVVRFSNSDDGVSFRAAMFDKEVQADE